MARNELSTDAKFQAYVSLYANLDTLLWQNVAVMVAVTTLGFAAVGTVLEKNIAIAGLTINQTVALVLLIMAALLLTLVYTSWRMRVHHLMMDRQLRMIESSGYFHSRRSTTSKWWMSAPFVNGMSFGTISAGAIALAIYLFR
jgi:hypothetical protein